MKKKIILTFDVDGLWAQEQLWNKFDKLKIEKIIKNYLITTNYQSS
jgi:hypothetical protein|tara:strand:+ start:229 stop:366 length:138 start_codon:yes stop_codon:yes gene_type:complete